MRALALMASLLVAASLAASARGRSPALDELAREWGAPVSLEVQIPRNGGTCAYFQLLRSDSAAMDLYLAQVAASNWTPSPSHSGGLDPISYDCAGCHDGSSAPDVPTRFQAVPNSPPSEYNHTTRHQNHPIGMNYAYSSSSPALRKREQLPENMRFIDSKVGCLSCHDPMNDQTANNLVISNEYSRLCLACHIK